jgi:hypothetical protein
MRFSSEIDSGSEERDGKDSLQENFRHLSEITGMQQAN